MKRCLFNLLAGLSLALFLATVVAWVRGYSHDDTIMRGFIVKDSVPFVMRRDGIVSSQGDISFRTAIDTIWDPSDIVRDRDELNEKLFGYWADSLSAGLPGTTVGGTDTPVDSSGIHVWQFGPLGCTEVRFGQVAYYKSLYISDLSLTVVFLVAPSWRAFHILRQRRRFRTGECATCGYDLRATPDKCPECGAIPKAAKYSN